MQRSYETFGYRDRLSKSFITIVKTLTEGIDPAWDLKCLQERHKLNAKSTAK